MKAYFGICVIRGMNILPKIAEYVFGYFCGKEGIKRVMPKNTFAEISQFLHLKDWKQEPIS